MKNKSYTATRVSKLATSTTLDLGRLDFELPFHAYRLPDGTDDPEDEPTEKQSKVLESKV